MTNEETPSQQDRLKKAARERFEELMRSEHPHAPLNRHISNDDTDVEYQQVGVDENWKGYLAAYMPMASSLEAAERERNEAKAALRAALALSQRADGWVACSERLPERGRQVLCAFQRSVFAGFNLGADDGWWGEDGSHVEVDHWRPLPAPPEQEATR